MKALSVSFFLSLWFMTLGCASLSNTPKVMTSCSFEDTWSVSLASVDEFELRRIDKNKGVIEVFDGYVWLADNPDNAGQELIVR